MAAKQKALNKALNAARVKSKTRTDKKARETDVAGLELAFRTTTETYQQLGARFGITAARVCQLAKELGWKRGDMRDRVRAKADAKVAEAEARAAGVLAGTEAAIDTTAVVMAETIIRERKSVTRLMAVAEKLLAELEKPRRSKAERAQPLAARIDSLRKLGATMTQLIDLERSVLGITDATPLDPTRAIEEAVESALPALKARFNSRLGK